MNIYNLHCVLKDPDPPSSGYPICMVVTSTDAQTAYDDFIIAQPDYNLIGIAKLEEIP